MAEIVAVITTTEESVEAALVAGARGRSAYEIWLAAGNTGTEADYLADLVGETGPAGPAGPDGQQGLPGNDGAAGADGAPGLPGADGAPGAPGADGTDGRTILHGMVAPTTEGEDGDFYIDTTTNILYGPKATTWPAGISLIGPAGVDGADGTNGTDGTDGVDASRSIWGAIYG